MECTYPIETKLSYCTLWVDLCLVNTVWKVELFEFQLLADEKQKNDTKKVWYNNRVIKIAIPKKKPESLMRSFRDNTVCVYDSG